MEYQHLIHRFGPVYDENSKILILGSFPSVKSRETNFYYGHPQNRFWKVMAKIASEAAFPAGDGRPAFFPSEAVSGMAAHPAHTGENGPAFFLPETVEEKKAFLLQNRIALWDVIFSCDIAGSSDSSIKNVVQNDLTEILQRCDIRQIFANGKTAGRLYEKYILPQTGREICILPSTSPANAACGYEKLAEAWRGRILPYLRS